MEGAFELGEIVLIEEPLRLYIARYDESKHKKFIVRKLNPKTKEKWFNREQDIWELDYEPEVERLSVSLPKNKSFDNWWFEMQEKENCEFIAVSDLEEWDKGEEILYTIKIVRKDK